MNVSLSLTFASNAHSAVVSSFSQSSPSFILSWHAESNAEGGSTPSIPDGATVGCEDGSLYLFRTSISKSLRRRSSTGSLKIATNTANLIDLGSPISPRTPCLGASRSRRSLSPSSTKSTFSPFQVTKSRVVSSVSAEQVEAPKNYVDFEDEEQKLRGMVKRKGVKDKTVVDSILSGVEKTLPDKSAASSATHSARPSISQGTEGSKTLPSASMSRSSSAQSLASLPSPLRPYLNESDPFLWTLVSHTTSPYIGAGKAIRDMGSLANHGMVLCLHDSGHIEAYSTEDGSCLAAANVEGGYFLPPTGAKANSKLPQIWHWKRLHVIPSGQSHLVLVTASSEATSSTVQPLESDRGREEETRVVVFELCISRQGDPEHIKLKKAGDWSFTSSAESIELCQDINRDHLLLHIDSSGHLIRQTLNLVDSPSTPGSTTSGSNSSTNLALPNPFKALKALKSSENLNVEVKEDLGRIQLGEAFDLGLIPLSGRVSAVRLVKHENTLRGLMWSSAELCLFDLSYSSVRNLVTIPADNVRDARWSEEQSLTMLHTDHADIYKLTSVDPNNDPASQVSQISVQLLRPEITHTAPLPASDTVALSSVGSVLSTRTRNGRRRLYYSTAQDSVDTGPRTLWKARREDLEQVNDEPRLTSLLPIELDHIIMAFSDGLIARSSLRDLITHGCRRTTSNLSDIPLSCVITGMHLVQNDKTGERRIIGGADDGSIAIWSLNTLKLMARWTVFLEPLAEVIYLSSGRLRGCAFCISRDGTIALVAVDGCQFLHLVPASVASLQRVCLGEDNLLLCYADGRARLWDTKTREFWRSMSVEKADEMLKQGGWTQWPVMSQTKSPSATIAALPGAYSLPDAATTLTFDLEAFLLHHGTGTVPPGARSSEFLSAPASAGRRDQIRSVLSALLTFSLNEEIDRLCREQLHIDNANVAVGISAHGATTFFIERGPRGPWIISPEVTAVRASAIVALLQALLQYEEHSSDARTVCVFYTASLAQVVGASYKAPNLAVLALQWLQAKAPELRNASRLRFEAGIVRLLDEEVIELVDSWQNSLPSLQEESVRDSTRCAMALFICGTVAIEKYTLLQTGCLTDIAKSIAIYLHDEASPHRALAIDLCSRGFPVWQQYVDAVEILRALFTLATSSRKESISTHNVGQQARTAVLQIASSNTPLFMTTLSIDILQPKSVQHRKSVLQLVIFLIHKKPLALYSNLPRLVEAVVKSLDPNSNASREAVLDSATEILGHIVDTYPTVDFHGPSQRLAVGTSEGAVVMYDLKTATRLYVLEGHKKRTTACSFSPDGRRLMTLSLDESTVLVWKVGSSFTSFFMPGAPPRQGHSGSEPYKTFSFNIAEEGIMTVAETLELIKFEWVGDRSVKLMIRNATLTFST